MRTWAIALAAAALAVVAGCRGRKADDAQAAASAQTTAAGVQRQKTIYTCAMHPEVIRNEPGSCPICGMKLVAKKIDVAPPPAPAAMPGMEMGGAPTSARAAGTQPAGAVQGLAVVTIGEAERQRIGVGTEEAMRMNVVNHIRTVGRVTTDERTVTSVHTRFGGWVQRLHVDFTGQQVRQGDPLLDVYSPDLVSAQQDYLVAYRAAGDQRELLDVARRRLKLLDVTDAQIHRLEETGTPQTTLTIYAPRSGTVIDKFVSAGDQITPEMALYTVADLGTVWVLADAYEADLPFVKVGQQVTVEMPASPNGGLTGRVQFVSPVVNVTTRTAPFRMEFPGVRGMLRPGSFVNVQLDVPLGQRLVIPTSGVLDSGTRKLVFVETQPGVYEPREVTLGVRADDHVEVRSGVAPGERIVTRAAFLIDSESRLRATMSGVTGMPGMPGMSGGDKH